MYAIVRKRLRRARRHFLRLRITARSVAPVVPVAFVVWS